MPKAIPTAMTSVRKVSPTMQEGAITVAMTGANGDCGREAMRLMAAVPEVAKVIMTCRSQAKADKAIADVMTATGKTREWFDVVILDVMDLKSVAAAIDAFPPVDRLCLNVGGISNLKMHPTARATNTMVLNTLGHAALADGLLAAGKLKPGARVVFVGSEVCRNLWAMVPLLPSYCGDFKENDIEWALRQSYSSGGGTCGCIPVRAQLGDYKNSKIIGSMHFSAMAKERPDIHWMTISPGAIAPDGCCCAKAGTGFTHGAYFPIDFAMKRVPCMFKLMDVVHPLEAGTKRYIDGVLTGESRWPNGAVVLSAKGNGCGCGLCYWGANGKVNDNRPTVPYLKDEALCKKASEAVRQYNAAWYKAEGLDRPQTTAAAQSMQR